jgi:hypothetical protein
MLFKDGNGNLIEINKYAFKNDKLYYQKIMELKYSLKQISAKSKQTSNNKDKQ